MSKAASKSDKYNRKKLNTELNSDETRIALNFPSTEMNNRLLDQTNHENFTGDGSNENRFFPKPKPKNQFLLTLHFIRRNLARYMHFVGPGVIISVAYIDPGNYATDVSAGARFQYKQACVIVFSSMIAVFLQALSCKLGTVTGYDLARCHREYFPKWLCYIFYAFAEMAIIATDLAEVTGSAIALYLLFKIPLPVGVIITFLDVMVCLLFYRPDKSIKSLRYFEILVSAMVFMVVICFTLMLIKIRVTRAVDVLKGFIPSKDIFFGRGVYETVGIVGATVMPHSLFLGSGIVQSRLRNYDIQNGFYDEILGQKNEHKSYKPSLQSIRFCLKISVLEVSVSLMTFAFYTNLSILIVAGATVYKKSDALDADLFTIYDLLQKYLMPGVGTIYAIALLMSGISSGIVGTMAGQFVAEGYLNWKMRPWLRRLIVRSIAICPCLVIATAVGKQGVSILLQASQVLLTVLLPILTAPLIYFTCSKKIMRVSVDEIMDETGPNSKEFNKKFVYYQNSFLTTVVAISVWLLIALLNLFLVIWLIKGVN